MSNRNRHWKSRSDSESVESAFERALLGDEAIEHEHRSPHEDRKTLQLCRQVQRAISLALGGECADELLGQIYVESVQPMGGASQLMVRVAVPAHCNLKWMDVLTRLNERSGKLRAIVAQSICRKRVPNLNFIVVAETAPGEGGVP